MLIKVKYVDDRFDMVRPDILDRLLEAGKVREFRRSDGWVVPGIDNLRRKKSKIDFTDTDRRRMQVQDRRAAE